MIRAETTIHELKETVKARMQGGTPVRSARRAANAGRDLERLLEQTESKNPRHAGILIGRILKNAIQTCVQLGLDPAGCIELGEEV